MAASQGNGNRFLKYDVEPLILQVTLYMNAKGLRLHDRGPFLLCWSHETIKPPEVPRRLYRYVTKFETRAKPTLIISRDDQGRFA